MFGNAQPDGRLPLYNRRRNVIKCEDFRYYGNMGLSETNLADTGKIGHPKTSSWVQEIESVKLLRIME